MQCLISDIAPVKSPKFSFISLGIESKFSKDSKKQFLYQRVNPDIDSLAATIMENSESGFASVRSHVAEIPGMGSAYPYCLGDI